LLRDIPGIKPLTDEARLVGEIQFVQRRGTERGAVGATQTKGDL